MKSLLTSEEIISQSEGLQLYKNLVLQINKDFKRANLEAVFFKDITPSELKLKLQEVIYHLILNKYNEYLNLLYIIDVSEEKIKKIEGNNIIDISEQITYLVLLREWQKIWFKKNY
jgi:hypothetical protein